MYFYDILEAALMRRYNSTIQELVAEELQHLKSEGLVNEDQDCGCALEEICNQAHDEYLGCQSAYLQVKDEDHTLSLKTALESPRYVADGK